MREHRNCSMFIDMRNYSKIIERRRRDMFVTKPETRTIRNTVGVKCLLLISLTNVTTKNLLLNK